MYIKYIEGQQNVDIYQFGYWRRIILEENLIDIEGAKLISEGLRINTVLKSIDLSIVQSIIIFIGNNTIYGKGVKCIFDVFIQNKSLVSLSMGIFCIIKGNNKITSTDAKYIAHVLNNDDINLLSLNLSMSISHI